ncbi:hypothetical protein MTP10_32930 [Nonomuraea sp. 3-1Str]|nr:hypothetical protein [Nonomuraea sp. 3-1Str]MDR8413529.1 hypothetical protein [Nonomuraea sp. 3-1Str]
MPEKWAVRPCSVVVTERSRRPLGMFRGDRLGEDLAEQLSPASGRATRPATLKSLKVTRSPEAAETVVVAVTSKPRVVRTRARIRSEP